MMPSPAVSTALKNWPQYPLGFPAPSNVGKMYVGTASCCCAVAYSVAANTPTSELIERTAFNCLETPPFSMMHLVSRRGASSVPLGCFALTHCVARIDL